MPSNLHITAGNIGVFFGLNKYPDTFLHSRKSGKISICTTQMKYFHLQVDILLSSRSQILVPKFKKPFEAM